MLVSVTIIIYYSAVYIRKHRSPQRTIFS